jgi:hypothetical protein
VKTMFNLVADEVGLWYVYIYLTYGASHYWSGEAKGQASSPEAYNTTKDYWLASGIVSTYRIIVSDEFTLKVGEPKSCTLTVRYVSRTRSCASQVAHSMYMMRISMRRDPSFDGYTFHFKRNLAHHHPARSLPVPYHPPQTPSRPHASQPS